MTLPESVSPPATSTSALKTTFRSPPPKKHRKETAPPLPPFPIPPTVVPGPNAFAQWTQLDIAQEPMPEKQDQDCRSTGDDHSPVNMNAERDPAVASSEMRRGNPKKHRSHRRDNSHSGQSSTTTTDSSYANNPSSASAYGSSRHSPEGSVFWPSSHLAHSQFFQQMRKTRARLDGDIDTRDASRSAQGSLEVMTEELKLLPSPNSKAIIEPTYRAAVNGRAQERLRHLIENNGALDTSTQIANVLGRPPVFMSPKQNKRFGNTSIPRSSRSPKRNFFSKFGLGVKLAPLADQNAPDGSHDMDLGPLRNLPPKAAKVLGAKSLPARDKSIVSEDAAELAPDPEENYSPSFNESHPAFGAPFSENDGIENSRRSGPERANKTKVYQETDLHSLPQRVVTRVPQKESLKFYDDENPPTPPSKPKPDDLKRHMHVESDQGGEAVGSEDQSLSTLRHGRHQGSPTIARAGRTGHHDGVGLVHDSPNIPSMYGTFDGANLQQETRSPSQRYSLPEQSPRACSRWKSHGLLAPSWYDPASPGQAQWLSAGLSGSPNSLKPTPLTIPPHLRTGVTLPKDGAEKPRETSNSTSASVPIFLESSQNNSGVPNPLTVSSKSAERSEDVPQATEDIHENGDASMWSSPMASATQETLQNTLTEILDHHMATEDILQAHTHRLEQLKQQALCDSRDSSEFMECAFSAVGDDIEAIKLALVALTDEREGERDSAFKLQRVASSLTQQVTAVAEIVNTLREDMTRLAQESEDRTNALKPSSLGLNQTSTGTQTTIATNTTATSGSGDPVLHYSTGIPTPPRDLSPSSNWDRFVATIPASSHFSYATANPRTPSPARCNHIQTYPPRVSSQQASKNTSPPQQLLRHLPNTSSTLPPTVEMRGYLRSVPQAAETRADLGQRVAEDLGAAGKGEGSGRERWTG